MSAQEEDRNYGITNRIFTVLNAVKDFDVSLSNPRMGRLIVRYKGESFFLDLDPIYPDKNKDAEIKDFATVIKQNKYFFQ